MENTRRGFLKTLGKLTAAVGITAAACSVPHEHPRYPRKAKPRTPSRAKNTLKGYPGTTASEQAAEKWKYGFTGFKKAERNAVQEPIKFTGNVTVTNRPVNVDAAVEMTSRHQEWLNRMTSARIDNMKTSVPSEYFFPYDHHERSLRELDAYNWRGVYALKWEDWKQRTPAHDTITGVWLATVRPYFESCFEKPCFYRTVTISKRALHNATAWDIKKHVKDNGYREIVRDLQDEILNRIKRNVRQHT